MMIFTKFGHIVRPLLVLPFEHFRKIYITQMFWKVAQEVTRGQLDSSNEVLIVSLRVGTGYEQGLPKKAQSCQCQMYMCNHICPE